MAQHHTLVIDRQVHRRIQESMFCLAIEHSNRTPPHHFICQQVVNGHSHVRSPRGLGILSWFSIRLSLRLLGCHKFRLPMGLPMPNSVGIETMRVSLPFLIALSLRRCDSGF
nr:related to iron-responsive element-binding protein [imported] - Neurospora crassa [Neurospora crassa]